MITYNAHCRAKARAGCAEPASVATEGVTAPRSKGGQVLILGMSIEMFTQVHVIISLIGIVTGLAVLRGMLAVRTCEGWTAIFLITTILTSVTGFLFPVDHILPSHVVGVISLVVLAIVLVALYGQRLQGPWRRIYVGGAVLALYLNVFVLVAQSFMKVPALNRLAPTQSEPPFAVAQLIVLATFIVLGVRAVKRFHPAGPTAA
jgi:hypothetical protein